MKRKKKAVKLFQSGCNCSQAMAVAFGRDCGLDKKTAMNLGRAFGGGMGQSGSTCGAITGAIMVLGFSRRGAKESKARSQANDATRELLDRFVENRGALACRKLLDKEGLADAEWLCAKGKGKFRPVCTEIVKETAEILDDLLPRGAARKK